MAKPIKRKNTKKEVNVKVNGDTVKTACKTFGAPLKNESNEYVSKCKTCSAKKAEICAACEIKFLELNPVIVKKSVSKRVPNNDMRDIVNMIIENPLFSRKAIVEKMSKNSARSEGGLKTMTGGVALAMKYLNGADGKGSFYHAAAGILKGINDLKKLTAYVAKIENKEPKILTRSVQYVFSVHKFMPAKEA